MSMDRAHFGRVHGLGASGDPAALLHKMASGRVKAVATASLS